MRIVGGKDAVKSSWPSIVFIYFKYTFDVVKNNIATTETTSASCGGTLLDKTTVITAAHCIMKEVWSSTDNSLKKIQPNAYHKTFESTYNLYFGLHNANDAMNNNLPSDSVMIQPSSITVVS